MKILGDHLVQLNTPEAQAFASPNDQLMPRAKKTSLKTKDPSYSPSEDHKKRKYRKPVAALGPNQVPDEPIVKRRRGRKKGSKNKRPPPPVGNENNPSAAPFDVNAPRPKRQKALQAVHAAAIAAKKGPVLTAPAPATAAKKKHAIKTAKQQTIPVAITKDNFDIQFALTVKKLEAMVIDSTKGWVPRKEPRFQRDKNKEPGFHKDENVYNLVYSIALDMQRSPCYVDDEYCDEKEEYELKPVALATRLQKEALTTEALQTHAFLPERLQIVCDETALSYAADSSFERNIMPAIEKYLNDRKLLSK